MIFRFTLIDRDGNEHPIDEPIGWDSMEIVIKRDPDAHGVMFDYQGNDFSYTGLARKLIREEYKKYGVEGQMTLVIEGACEGNYFEELYRGRLLFGRYDDSCGDDCTVKIPIETTSDVMMLRNRWDQKVDLNSTTAFDKVTPLAPYAFLGKEITLPSKGVFIRNHAINDQLNMTPVAPVPLPAYGMISPGFNVTKASEIGSFVPEASPLHDIVDNTNPGTQPTIVIGTAGAFVWPLYLSPIVNFHSTSPNYNSILGLCTLQTRMKGVIRNTNPSSTLDPAYGKIYAVLCRLPDGKLGEDAADYNFLGIEEITDYDPVSGPPPFPMNALPFDVQFNVGISLQKGDRIYLFLSIYSVKDFSVEFDTDSFFKMEVLSNTLPSKSKIYLVNEAWSRAAEAVTDGRIRAYSEYFGRTDSKPYSHEQDGCGGLEAITKGIFIRGQESRNGPMPMTVSLKDLWEGLDPIHHIGFGIEADDKRPGYSRLRVEHWKYFYKDDLLLVCTDVARVRTRAVESEHISVIRIGYEKWEAEEYTGLDEFLTKRAYRTSLTQVKTELSRLSKFIASGYTWEITRRKKTESKDWKYDNDVFIICLKRDDSEIEVELGEIDSPQNIISPDTIYNYRISPVRNLMRWMDRVLASYREKSAGNKLYFMDGDGNLFAEGEYSGDGCKIENQPLTESQDIDISVFADVEQAEPILRPERVEFDYPLNVRQFRKILNNPHGRIAATYECGVAVGWIDEIRYKPNDGMASFRIIPQYTIKPGDTQLEEGIATEAYEFILDEPANQNLLTED